MSEIHTVEEHRAWANKLSGIVGPHLGDIMNAYAMRQKGPAFCPTCNNPLCKKCYENGICAECGHILYR